MRKTAVPSVCLSFLLFLSANCLGQESAEDLFKKAQDLANSGRFKEAIQDYSKAISLKPGYTEAYANRGHSFLSSGQYKQALEDFTKTIELDRKRPDGFYNRGVAYIKSGDYAKAIKDFDEALYINREYADALCNRGFARQALGDHSKAVEDFSSSIRIDSRNADAYFNRGVSQASMGHYGEAIEDYEKAISLDPENSNALCNRGMAYAALKDYPKAMEDLDRATRFLGRRFSVTGAVTSTSRRGASLGFPTANLAVDPGRALPSDGVYVTIAHVSGERHASVTNIGHRPTFRETERVVETHILDFHGCLYGDSLTVEFAARLRDETPFPDREHLVAQIEKDVTAARRILGANE